MLNNNSLPLGLLYGSITPAFAWFIFKFMLHNEGIIMGKPAVPYLIAIGLNLLLLRFVFKKGLVKTANGIMVVSFIFMITVFILKMRVSG